MPVKIDEFVYGLGCRISKVNGELCFTGDRDGESCRFQKNERYIVITKKGLKYEEEIRSIDLDTKDKIEIGEDVIYLRDVIFIGILS